MDNVEEEQKTIIDKKEEYKRAYLLEKEKKKKKTTQPENQTVKYNIPVKANENRKEYNRLVYQQRKEELIQKAKERYSENTSEHKETTLKNLKKYREGFKLLKKLYEDNLVPSVIKDEVDALFN